MRVRFISALSIVLLLAGLVSGCADPPARTPRAELAHVELTSEEGLLPINSVAPAFNLQSTGKRYVSLKELRGKNIVLVFYPMDNTSGCTIQLCRLRDGLADFTAANTVIIASNPGSLDSHEDFAARQKYTFPILVDTDNTMARNYQVASPVMNTRTVYVIDGEGRIRYAKRGMPLNDELLAVIQKINAAPAP
jgi:thioredoxin-dependent peroxiredoxin